MGDREGVERMCVTERGWRGCGCSTFDLHLYAAVFLIIIK